MNKVFCLARLEKLIKFGPGGSGVRPPTEIWYKYNSRKFLVFIADDGGVSTNP